MRSAAQLNSHPILAALVVGLVAQVVAVVRADDLRALAIAPFANISQQPSDGWIGIGIAETIATDLPFLGDVRVVGWSLAEAALANAASGTPEEPDQAAALESARALGAELVLTGSYQRVGDQLRITAKLVDVQSGSTIHALKIDGVLSDLFQLQDQLVAELGASTVKIKRPNRSPVAIAAPETAVLSDVRPALVDERTAAPNSRSELAPPKEGNSSLVAPGSSIGANHQGQPTMGPGEATGALVIDSSAPTADASTGTALVGCAFSDRPTIRAARATEPPVIDGLLDDLTWRGAALVTEFVQTRPVEGAQPTDSTEVWIAYDANNLYFAFYAHYTDTTLIRANRVDRDRAGRDDWIAVMFDPFLDQQRAYRFSVNAYGVQGDAIINAGRRHRGPPGGGGDRSWNALFDSGGQLVWDGWTAEMAIPLKSLRYPSRGEREHRWGFQITRTIQSKDETIVWSPVSRDTAGFLTQMGVLSNISKLSTSRNLEILPTVAAIQLGQLNDSADAFVESAVAPDVGLNVKYGVTSNLTADFTANPDFSQIESDRPQIETNQRFPLFFPELRPFFLESQEIFDTPSSVNLVHTRTIVDPQFGGKLTGKIGKTMLGVLVANDKAPGKRDDPVDPGLGKTGQVFIGRARYDLYAESYIGGIFTDREFLNAYSRVAGVDGRFRIGSSHSMQFVAVTSANRDEAGSETSGPMIDVSVRRDSRNFDYGIQYNSIDPEFDTATGFVRRVDVRRLDADVAYSWWPERWVINWGPGFFYQRNVDHAGILQDEHFRMAVGGSFANNIFVRIDGRRELERFRSIDFRKTRFSFRNGISASRRFSLFYGANWGDRIRFINNPFLGKAVEFNVRVTLLPTSRLRTNISLDTNRFTRSQNRAHKNSMYKSGVRSPLTSSPTDCLSGTSTSTTVLVESLGLTSCSPYRVNAGTIFYVGYDEPPPGRCQHQ